MLNEMLLERLVQLTHFEQVGIDGWRQPVRLVEKGATNSVFLREQGAKVGPAGEGKPVAEKCLRCDLPGAG